MGMNVHGIKHALRHNTSIHVNLYCTHVVPLYLFYVFLFSFFLYVHLNLYAFFLPLSRVLYVVYVSVENYVLCTRLK